MNLFEEDPNEIQQRFERKVIKKVLPCYKKSVHASYEEIKHVNTLERLSNLEYIRFAFGSYKATQALVLGNLLNSFNRTVIKTALKGFLDRRGQDDRFVFVIDICSSTALYALVLRDDFEMDIFDNKRFRADMKCDLSDRSIMVSLVRLDDLLEILFNNQED